MRNPNEPTDTTRELFLLAAEGLEPKTADAPPLDTMVAYLANALSPEEAHAVREAAARQPATRKQLAEVYTILEGLQAVPLSEIVARPADQSLDAQVSHSWLGLIRRSIQFSLQSRLSETKAHIKDLIDAVERNLEDYWAGIALHGPGATRPTESALSPNYRSGPEDGISLEGAVEDNGDLVVHVNVSPDHAAEWESRQVEVHLLLNVRLPLKIGAGTVKNGQTEIRAYNVRQLLDIASGPMDPAQLTVRAAEDERIVWPIEGAVFTAAECPRLTETPRVENGRLHLAIEIPAALRHGYPDSTLALDASFTLANWQRILALPLKDAPPTYETIIDCTQTPGLEGLKDLNGHINPPLRFQVVSG